MNAPVFPSVTMKDVDRGHIEHHCSRNIKGLFASYSNTLLTYAWTCNHIEAKGNLLSPGRSMYSICVFGCELDRLHQID